MVTASADGLPFDGVSRSLRGLSEDEVAALRASFGPNEPAPRPAQRLILQLLRRFTSPLVAILLFACAVSAALGDLQDAAIIVVMVVASMVIDFVQTHRSERAAASLEDKVAHTATALRDGTYREVLRRDLVPGDVVRLAAGDMVPADARIAAATSSAATRQER